MPLWKRQETARLLFRPDQGSEGEDFVERRGEVAHDTQGGRNMVNRACCTFPPMRKTSILGDQSTFHKLGHGR